MPKGMISLQEYNMLNDDDVKEKELIVLVHVETGEEVFLMASTPSDLADWKKILRERFWSMEERDRKKASGEGESGPPAGEKE